ncbi:zinc finger CCCH domain-containing protein 2-like [Canna indica]|uniref:Zinc finger CCCH domain-containing protein 2-like n=1 Tax=Canna indica TaxID=4628 RepID=A0AAQ3QIM0_9LILI|nr:zinc finger CCCH domain-containing protein 2-like [Canna indica]
MMTMIAEGARYCHDPTVEIGYHHLAGGVGEYGLRRYVLCAGAKADEDEDEEEESGGPDVAVDVYSSDEFRMYEFKVRMCSGGRSHDWTECPFAHPGEKARRRDPRRYRYSGTACPDFRKGCCRRGDSCEFAHGVFECWLHPVRYRTQPCKDGTACRRRVCFFAHTPDQLRVLPQQQQQKPSKFMVDSYDGSPLRQKALESYLSKYLMSTSPTSTLMSPPTSPPSDSPPTSPRSKVLRQASWPGSSSLTEIVASMQQLQLSMAKSAPTSSAFTLSNSFIRSPRGTAPGFKSEFCSLPSTPVATVTMVDGGEEPVERVESGRALRAKMFEKMSKECVTERA